MIYEFEFILPNMGTVEVSTPSVIWCDIIQISLCFLLCYIMYLSHWDLRWVSLKENFQTSTLMSLVLLSIYYLLTVTLPLSRFMVRLFYLLIYDSGFVSGSLVYILNNKTKPTKRQTLTTGNIIPSTNG